MPQAPNAIHDGLTSLSSANPDEVVPDCIVRCGDGIDLPVQTARLRSASIFFNDMLASDTNSTEVHSDGKPAVVLPEPSVVLHRLLSTAYQGRSLEHESHHAQYLDGVWVVHRAATKYAFMGVQEVLEKQMEAFVDTHPHRLFAVARLCDLPDLARKAALATLEFPICPPGIECPEFEVLPAGIYLKVFNFHNSCGKAAQGIVKANLGPIDHEEPLSAFHEFLVRTTEGNDEFVWWKVGSSGFHDGDCGPEVHDGYLGQHSSITPAPWFMNHIAKLARKLRAIPAVQTVEAEACALADADRALLAGCNACSEHAEHDLRVWKHQLRLRIATSNTEHAFHFGLED